MRMTRVLCGLICFGIYATGLSAQCATPNPASDAPAAVPSSPPSSEVAHDSEGGTQSNPIVVVESVAAPLRKRMVVNYPKEAVDAKISGRVKIQLLLGKSGAVLATRVVEGAEPLASAARTSVSRAEFSPMTVNGEPVYMATTLRLVFTLDDKTAPPTAKVGELLAQ